MDRRSFVLSLFGGLAATAIGGAGLAQAATPAAATPVPNPEDIAPDLKAALDGADADFTQAVVRRRTTVVRRGPYGRPVVVRRSTVVRRPPRYYRRGRPVVVRRRVYVR